MSETMHLNYQNAVDEYDEEMVNLSISLFLTETYNELKVKMPEAYKKKDYQAIKAIAHKFKTTSKYMGADEFAVICGKIQKCVDEGNDSLNKMDELYQTFMSKLEVLLTVCTKQNEIIEKTINEVDAEKEMDDDFKFEGGDNNNNNDDDNSIEYNNEVYDDEVNKREIEQKEEMEKSVEFILKIESNDRLSNNNNNSNANISNKKNSTKLIYQKSKSAYDNMLMNSDKKLDKPSIIQIRYSKAIQTFDKDIIDVIIQKFVNEEYKVIKTNLITAFKKKDTKVILTQLHTMKLKAKYMCAEEFTDNILKVENCIKDSDGEDLKQLELLFPEFIENMELLYKEVQDCYEKNHQKQMNDSITPTTPSFNKDFVFNNKNYYDQMANNSLENSPLHNLKKPSSVSKFGGLSNNAKLREFDQFSNRNIMSSNKKGMFDIDLTLLRTTDNDSNNTFDLDAMFLFSKFKESIDNASHKNLIESITRFKDVVVKYKFNVLIPYIEEWLQLIRNNKEFRLLNASYDDICILLNQMKNIMKEKKEFNCSRTPVNFSSHKMISDSPSCSTANKNEENILSEMKPLSMNYFYSSSYSPEELEMQINQIITHHAEEKKEKGGFIKHLVKPIKATASSRDVIYPFKEETISCIIV